MRHYMKLTFYHPTLIFLSIFAVISNCSCQSNSANGSPKAENRIFNKKPIFDTLLNDFAKPIGYVNDYDGLFTSEQIFEMDSLIYDFETKTSIQLVVVTFDSSMTKPNEIDKITQAIGNGWRVGGDSSKGSVIGISKPFKRMRIQNGKYIQRILSDSATQEIINSYFIPEFKNDNYYKGTISGLKATIINLQNAIASKTKVKY